MCISTTYKSDRVCLPVCVFVLGKLKNYGTYGDAVIGKKGYSDTGSNMGILDFLQNLLHAGKLQNTEKTAKKSTEASRLAMPRVEGGDGRRAGRGAQKLTAEDKGISFGGQGSETSRTSNAVDVV